MWKNNMFFSLLFLFAPCNVYLCWMWTTCIYFVKTQLSDTTLYLRNDITHNLFSHRHRISIGYLFVLIRVLVRLVVLLCLAGYKTLFRFPWQTVSLIRSLCPKMCTLRWISVILVSMLLFFLEKKLDIRIRVDEIQRSDWFRLSHGVYVI